jgi:hypothetical protein
LVHRTFIKFIGDHSNCQTSILSNESPHAVDVLVLTEAGRPDRGSSCTVSGPFAESLFHWNTWARDRDSLPNAFCIFS